MSTFEDLKKFIVDGDLEGLTELVDKHQELLQSSSPRNETLLTEAISANNINIVRYLLDCGATQGTHPSNALQACLFTSVRVKGFDKKIIPLLVERGVPFPWEDDQQVEIFSSAIISSILYSKDDDTLLKRAVRYGFDPKSVEKKLNISFIYKAIMYSNQTCPKLACEFIRQGCDIYGLEDQQPMIKALSHSRDKEDFYMVYALLDAGVDLAKVKGFLHVLASGYCELPKALLDRISFNHLDIDVRDDEGCTPLHVACMHSNQSILQSLIDYGAKINAVDVAGQTPLLVAIHSQNKPAIKFLVKNDADVNIPDSEGSLPLDIVQSKTGFKQIATLLEKAGAKSNLGVSADGVDSKKLSKALKACLEVGEPWAAKACVDILATSSEKGVLWLSLVRHCMDNSSTKPSNKWFKDAWALVEQIGIDSVRQHILVWLPMVKEKRTQSLRSNEDEDDYDYFYGDMSQTIAGSNVLILKGLLWICSRFVDIEVSQALRSVATSMYKKVYGVGMRNAKVANAAVYSLSVMPDDFGLKDIIVLRGATKYNPALVNINRVFAKLAQAKGVDSERLAELYVPDYGLTAIGEFRQTIGDYLAVLILTEVGKAELSWDNAGKSQKTVPKKVKDSYPDELQNIKTLLKDLKVATSSHSLRLEQLYLSASPMSFSTWRDQYVDHKLIAYLARRLLWRIKTGEQCIDVIYTPKGYINSEGDVVELPKEAEVELWHPTMCGAAEVLRWRQWLIDHEVTQPFKQAHREIYLLTDAERITKNHSMRFANHILKHSQFHALAVQRGWRQQRGGDWDGGQENSAYKSFPHKGISVGFSAEGVDAYGSSDTGIYECVGTSGVSFNKDLELIEPIVFSEAMRDVDLFVGVASIGNDPQWQDRNEAYWRNVGFGQLNMSAQTRREVIEQLIPKLNIGSQLRISDRFLHVKGSLREYKIHLGSSNILMEPNDSYLCIVGVNSKNHVTLPFEGDHMLTLILSKAFLLAKDAKIKDPVITSQLNIEAGA